MIDLPINRKKPRSRVGNIYFFCFMHLRENKVFMKSFESILSLAVLKFSSYCDLSIKIKFTPERGALPSTLANLKQKEKNTHPHTYT